MHWCFGRTYHSFQRKSPASVLGPRRATQADQASLCPQVHQQSQVREDESCLEHHPGTATAGRGSSRHVVLTSDYRYERPLVLMNFSTIQIDHPFVVNMRYAFQDDENCFFVLDLMLGGDLRCMCLYSSADPRHMLTPHAVHLDRLGSLPEAAVRVITAELASGLSFLHEKRIIHRCVPNISHRRDLRL